MGSNNSAAIEDAATRAQAVAGTVAVTSRYHRYPRSVLDNYAPDAGKVLGKGYSGEVVQVTSNQDGRAYALKEFRLHGLTDKAREWLTRECEIFLEMDHPHVARLEDVYASNEHLSLIMECCAGGQVFERVLERKAFSERQAADTVWQMLLAINYMHSQGVVHRDIKLENFLYMTPGGDSLKLIDFGFSKVWTPNTKMAQQCGTLSYMAPEVLNHKYTSQCDMWSMGVVLYILLFGRMPFFGSQQEKIHRIKAGRYQLSESKSSHLSQEGLGFMKALLVVDPNRRLTSKKAMEHVWLQQRHKQSTEVDVETVKSLCDFARMSKFKRTCMLMMAWSLTTEETASLRQLFLALDKDRSGVIELKEFTNAVREKLDLSDASVQEAFSALDASHTQEIRYTEFLAATMSTRVHLHEDLLQRTFRRFDKDNSGMVSVQNLKDLLGDSFAASEVPAILEEIGANQNSEISYQQIVGYLRGIGDEVDDRHIERAASFIDYRISQEPGGMFGPEKSTGILMTVEDFIKSELTVPPLTPKAKGKLGASVDSLELEAAATAAAAPPKVFEPQPRGAGEQALS